MSVSFIKKSPGVMGSNQLSGPFSKSFENTWSSTPQQQQQDRMPGRYHSLVPTLSELPTPYLPSFTAPSCWLPRGDTGLLALLGFYLSP